MALRFQKRIKIAPGVKLNLSRSGISTTVGPQGASVNVGKKGVYANAGLPGTGLSTRTRLDKPTRKTAKDAPTSPGIVANIVALAILIAICAGIWLALT